MGRPPKPIEHHRRTGRANGTKKADGRPLPELAVVTPLPMAEGAPVPPADFGLEARRLWGRIWADGITWISPDSDIEAAEQACRLADDLEVARTRYRATTDPKDGRMVKIFDDALSAALSRLGFDPTARSRLGVAEVRRVSALENLLDRRTRKGAR